VLHYVVGGSDGRIAYAYHKLGCYGFVLPDVATWNFLCQVELYSGTCLAGASVHHEQHPVLVDYKDIVLLHRFVVGIHSLFYLYNVYDFVETVRSAVNTRKGKVHRWYLYGTITDKICKR
jgi:hypothetical protein